jgi:hypothetical protein
MEPYLETGWGVISRHIQHFASGWDANLVEFYPALLILSQRQEYRPSGLGGRLAKGNCWLWE